MGVFFDRMRTLAIGLGAPGLFLVAFLDSSFLSLPEIADLLVIYMVTRHKGRLFEYVVATTMGSLLGCLVMYYIGKKGTDAVGRGRASGPRMERTLKQLRKHGVMAVLVPSILPPPMPFKIFILLAGVAGVPAPTFAIALVLGRGLRYGGEALLAMFYGDRVAEFIKANFATVSLWTLILSAVVILTLIVWRRVRKA